MSAIPPSAPAGPRHHQSPGATPWQAGDVLTLGPTAARHVQVLRLQPGDPLVIFDGRGGQWQACVESMGRNRVTATLQWHDPLECESATGITLALGMPANDRMDWLVEKATELGVAAIQPLMTRHSVLRLDGERGQRRREHWQAIAVAACEQCGRNRVPTIGAPQSFTDWLSGHQGGGRAAVLSLHADAVPWADFMAAPTYLAGASREELVVLSGPEGGLQAEEEAAAVAAGFQRVGLGPRVLRADTAPLVVLAAALVAA